LIVPSLDSAELTTSSAENGTCSSSSARVRSDRFVISAYDDAPRAAHSQTWRTRYDGSPASVSVTRSRSTRTR
jgi:hypothetical protein